jgi:diguanylate cyclase (GGDEF)-like protein
MLAVAVLGVLALVVGVLVMRFDAVARASQIMVAQQGFSNRLAEQAAVVRPRLESEEAVRHLTGRLDRDWAREELAQDFYQHNGLEQVFVIDAGGRLVFAADKGVEGTSALYRPAIRRAVADMGPHLGGGQASTIVFEGGRLLGVTATLVREDEAKGAAPIMVSVAPFDRAVLARFGAGRLVDGLAISGDLRERADRVVLPLHDIAGRVVAALIWAPRHPGRDLFADLQWPLAAMVVILLLLGASLVRQTASFARGLILSEARARHLAQHDALTGLPNRALMFERLNQLRAMAGRQALDVAVLCLDLDRFKEVNDTLGHPAGDALIRAAAKRLSGLLRDTDTVARLGGDEFVILQPHATGSGASHLAERIIHALGRPFTIEGALVEIGCSIGITLITDPTTPATELLRQADLALYSSKENGRNRATFFEAEMDAALRMRHQLETDLREALAEDLLHMVYQPQVDQAGRIVGVEALVRWNHPTKGMIAPTTFVQLAEECGLIAPLGDYIMRRVFADTRYWRGVMIAINVSALQLRAPGFMSSVTRLVADYAIDPTCYEFEITETVLLGDDAATRDNIAVLKQEGFSIALDDFGTGYSSLSSLQRFAVDRIKIDRSFVRNLDQDDAEAVTLVAAVIQLAHALELDVIAEGVETASQRDQLLASGCERFQGYFYARPAAPEVVMAMLASGAPLGLAEDVAP